MNAAVNHGVARRFATALLLVLSLVATSSAAGWITPAQRPPGDAPVPAGPDTTGFALVLSGGGARGLAHVGVLRALEELGMRPALVVGTSMGAIIGSLYASGVDASRLRALLTRRDWLDLLLDEREASAPVQGGWRGLSRPQVRLQLHRWPPVLPTGLSSGQSVEALLGQLTVEALVAADGDFDALPIPFRALATDVVAGRAVVFGEGALPHVVRASSSLPLIFVPVQYRGRMLMDGGLVDNIPLEVARELGFSRSLIVDVSNVNLTQEGPPDDLLSVIRRSSELAQMRQNQVEPRPGELWLRIDLRDHLSLGFWGAEEVEEKGYRAAMEMADELQALASERGAAASGPPPSPVVLGEVVLGEVEVLGARRISGWAVRRRLGIEPGVRLQLPELWRRAEHLGRQSAFDLVWIHPWRRPEGRVDVEVHVVERVHPELELAANYRDGVGAALLARLRVDNWLGAGSTRALSWRASDERAAVDLDLAQDLGKVRVSELRFRGGWMRERAEIFREGDEVDAWTFRRWEAALDLVSAGQDWPVAVWTGVTAKSVHRARESRVPGSADETEWRALHLGLETWTGGSLNPRPPRGVSAYLEWGEDVAGPDRQAWRLEAGWLGRRFMGRYLGVNAASGLALASSDLDVALQARAGGPLGWVGLRRDEIIAPRIAWQRLGLDLYLQREVRLELAGAMGWWGRRSLDEHRPRLGAQLQLVMDTFVGPVHLGVAGSRRGESFAFVDVGYGF